MGLFEDSLDCLKKSLQIIPQNEELHRVEIHRKIGDTLWDKGDVEESAKILEEGLKILGVHLPSAKWKVILGIIKEFFIQYLHILFPKILVAQEYKEDPVRYLISRIYGRLTHTYYFSDINKTFYLFLKNLNTLEKIGPCSDLAYLYIGGGPIYAAIGNFNLARRSVDKGIALAQKIKDKTREGCGYSYKSYVMYVFNNLEEAEKSARRGVDILSKLGEYWDLGVSYSFLLHSLHIRGRLKESVEIGEDFFSKAYESKSLQTLGWALFKKEYGRILIGDLNEQMLQNIDRGCNLCLKTKDFPNTLYALSVKAFFYLRKQNYLLAEKTVQEIKKLFPVYYNKGCWMLEAFPISAQVYIEMILNLSLDSFQKKQYLKKAKWFIQKGLNYSKTYPFIKSWTLRVYADYLYLIGKTKKAQKIFEQAIKFSKTHHHNYQLGMCYYDWARFLLKQKDPTFQNKAISLLKEAHQIFVKCGALLDQKNTEKLLGIKEEKKPSISEETTTTSVSLAEKSRQISLIEATHLISSILDLDLLLEKILQLSIKMSGAQRGFILLYHPQTKKLELALSYPQKNTSPQLDYPSLKISKTIISFVEKNKKGIIYPPISSQKELLQKSESILFYGIRSILCNPLLSKGHLLGMIYLDSLLAEGVFEEKDLEVLNTICNQASISIENARLYKEAQEKARMEQELITAHQIQQSLLPPKGIKIEDFNIEGIMQPAREVGGDYYDFILYHPHKIGIVVADVSGKGLDSGMVMSMTKSAIYTLSEQNLSPQQLVIKLNNLLYKQLHQQKFISLIYAEYLPQDNTLRWAGAGQEHIIIYSPQGIKTLKTGGIVLGMLEDVSPYITQNQIKLQPQQKIIFYTDGVIEAKNPQGKMLSLQGFLNLIQQTPLNLDSLSFLQHLKQKIQQFIQNAPQYDDWTVVVMGKGEGG